MPIAEKVTPINKKININNAIVGNKHIIKKPETFSASELMKMELPEPTWLVSGLICEGVTLLVGKPKLGKSWLCLGLGISVASGGMTLGQIETEQREVLYISLEDNKRRLQSRIDMIMKPDEVIPNRLILCTEWQKADEGGIEQLQEWITNNPNCKLIIIDTWSKFRGQINSRIGAYADDYNAINPIKKLASDNNVAIILVHHTRKMSGADVFDEVSGSTGLTGAVDTTIILKRDRGQADAVLHITGRDVEECEKALSFDKEYCQWKLIGDANKYKTSVLGLGIQELLKQTAKEMTPKEISTALNNTSLSYVKNTLNILLEKKLINRPTRGKYQCLSFDIALHKEIEVS